MNYGDQLNQLHSHEVIGTSGADTMFLSNSTDATLSPAAGNDVVWVKKGNIRTVVNAGAGNDSINNESNEFTQVYAGAGSDTIRNSGYDATLDGGDGDDYIYNIGGVGGGLESSIVGGAGKDTIINVATMSTIQGGEGNDLIRNSGLQTRIFGDAGNDTIINSADASMMTIDGGDGNDFISHNSTRSTLSGGAGNDTISLGGSASDNVIKYASGNDTIFGYTVTNTIDLDGATLTSRETLGNDLSLNINSGAGSILLKDAAGLDIVFANVGADQSGSAIKVSGELTNNEDGLLITGTPNADTINNYGKNVTIDALAGGDYVLNRGSNVLVYLGNGNDTFDTTWEHNTSTVKNATVYAGKGNDEIRMMYNADGAFIDLGEGDDGFYGSGEKATVLGGDGNDAITGYGSFYNYFDGGDGNDYIIHGSIQGTVIGGAGNDTIYNTGPNSMLYGGAGNDSIIAAGYDMTIDAGLGNDTIDIRSAANTQDVAVVAGVVVINYAAGDGNDIVTNLQSDSVIHITSGALTGKSVKDNDIILTISDGSNTGTITLKDSATLGAVAVMDSLGVTTSIVSALNVVNTTNNTLITGTDLDDSITNKNYTNVTINTGDGDDYVYNYTSITGGGNVTINTGKGKDTIINRAYDITTNTKGIYINAGDDDDHVYSQNATAVTIDGGAGNDDIGVSYGANASVNAGEGDNIVDLFGGYSFNNGTASNVHGGYVTVKAGSGNDTVRNNSSFAAIIDAGDGDNYIENNAKKASIKTGSGNDTIINYKEYTTILAGAGNDSIVFANKAGSGSSGSNSYVEAGAGDDYIYIDPHSENVTINGGLGNDTIVAWGKGHTIIYNSGDGNDVIENFQADTRFKINSDITNASLNGSDVILTIGDGKLTLKGGKNKEFTLIDKNDEESSLVVTAESTYTSKTTIPTGLSYNTDHTVLTVSDQYNGALAPANYDSVVDTINAGGRTKAINITGNANNNSIVGGAGKDTIASGGGDNTLDGGKGNDNLTGGAGNDLLIGGAGNDTMTGGAGNDTFQYTSGDGNDVITDFGVGNDVFKITNDTFSKITTSKKNSDVVLTIGKGKVTFKDAMTKTITVEDKNGNRNSIVGGINTIFNTTEKVTLTGLSSADSINNAQGAGTVTAIGGAGNDTIVNYGDHALIDAGVGNDYVFNEASNTTINGGAGNDTVRLTALNEYSIVDGGAGNDAVILGQYENGSPATTELVSVYGGAGNDSILSYVSYDSTINGGAGNDTIDLGDRINMSTNYKTQSLTIRYENGGGKDVITNYAEGVATISIDKLSDLKKVATGGKKAPNDVVFTIGKGSITIKDGVGKNVTFVDQEGNTSTQAYGSSSVTISDSMGDTIDVSKDTAVLEVDASGRSNGVTIIGNAKNNTISGGSGDDVLTGGKGKDVFVYSGGNDTITDYTAGQDIIKFAAGTYLTNASLSAVQTGADIIFYTNNGSLTIQKAVKTDKKGAYTGNKITVIDGDGINTGAQLYDSSDITVANADGGTIKANLEVLSINGSKRSKAAYYIDNDNDNTIVAGSGADTIVAGLGNDLLTGGKGKDLFIVSAANGNDTITDYTAKQDKIQIAKGTISTYSVSGKDVIFTLKDTETSATNYLTVVNGKDKAITLVDEKGTETSETYNDPRELVLTKNDSGKFDMNSDAKYSQIVIVDGTKTTKGVELIANANGNTLMGGKGKDILTGGLGADTFVYTTGGGNDTITNYVFGEDVIQLGKKTSITSVALSEVKDDNGNVSRVDYVFTIGKGKLTVQDGANQGVTFIDSAGFKFRYDAAYSQSAAFEERLDNELFSDDNFATDELSNIIESNNIIANDNEFDFNETADLSKKIKTTALTSNKSENK